MFKMRKCCNNPEYETIDSFYTYKEEPKGIYNYNNPYTYTYVTMPDKIINRIIEKANGIDFDKLKQLIHASKGSSTICTSSCHSCLNRNIFNKCNMDIRLNVKLFHHKLYSFINKVSFVKRNIILIRAHCNLTIFS